MPYPVRQEKMQRLMEHSMEQTEPFIRQNFPKQKVDGKQRLAVRHTLRYKTPQLQSELTGQISMQEFQNHSRRHSLKAVEPNQALADEAGLRSFGVAAMPKNQGFQVHTVGNGEMHGIYADQKGAVHSFSGTRVTQTYAQQNPESCVRLDDTTYLKIHEGSSNRAVNAYANATTFKNGTFQNKYDTKTHLNNDGSVGDGT